MHDEKTNNDRQLRVLRIREQKFKDGNMSEEEMAGNRLVKERAYAWDQGWAKLAHQSTEAAGL